MKQDSLTRCHWHKGEDRNRHHIPGCWGGVFAGPSGCYCNSQHEREKREKATIDEIEQLKMRIASLERAQR